MTTVELEQLVSETLPTLRRKLLKVEHHNDLLQRTLMAVVEDVNELAVCTPKQFINLVKSYFYRNEWIFNRRCYKAVAQGDYIGDYLLTMGGSKVLSDKRDDTKADGYISDPWNTKTTQALEYIELVTIENVRRVMIRYYIEGYTLAEIAKQEDISNVAVFKWLEIGVKEIKGLLAAGVVI